MSILAQNEATSLLSQEQMKMRQSGIGASEIAAVLGISPWASALDVWMRKSTPSREPLITDFAETMAMRIGNTLEEPIRQLYEQETGLSVTKPDITYRHPYHPFILATPDGVVDVVPDMPSKGLEIKTVGARMASAWENADTSSGVPDYVELQCRQNMAVLGYDTWDVAALLGGNDFQIFTVERDEELEAVMVEAATFFWSEYVQKDIAPEETDPDKRRALIAALFPRPASKKCVPPVDAPKFRELCATLENNKAAQKVLLEEKKEIENALMAMVGDGYGIESEDKKYRFTWSLQRGSVSYKDIAAHLAGGKIDDELMEQFRGADRRVARFTSKK